MPPARKRTVTRRCNRCRRWGVDPQVIKDTGAGKPTAAAQGFIRSPLAGTVVEKLVSPGQLLQAGTTQAFTVADLSKVWVIAHIFDTDIGAVHVGDIAQVSGPGRMLTGNGADRGR